ncbi:MAG TPA: lysophospholipid acyltransferase family protein [Thermodesulfobacteriota bacterium]|nr:lysophospholipid acyltransferase family protein [Thermodesulfobacteriota bacterium]
MGKNLSSFLQWQPNVSLIQKMGWPLAFKYVSLLGSFYYFLCAREKQKIIEAIQQSFADTMPPLEIKTIIRDVFRGILHHYCEKLFNAYESVPNLKAFFARNIQAPAMYKIDNALKRGKGVLFVTGHFGGIEYIPIVLSLYGYPVSVIIKCATDQLKERLHSKARDLGIRVIDADEKNILAAVIRDLRENRVVFIECDEIEEWKPSRTENISFLGKRIGVDKTINLIQRRSGARVVFGLLHRVSLQKYSFIIQGYEEIMEAGLMSPSSIGAGLLKAFERYVRQYPDRWYQWKKFSEFGPCFKTPLHLSQTSRGSVLQSAPSTYR